MKTKTFLFALLISLTVSAQTVQDDLQLLLRLENIEQVELIEYIKSRIDSEFLNYTLTKHTTPKHLILQYIADYLDAAVMFDDNGWPRLVPEGYSLYSCDVYSLDYKISICLPAKDDDKAYESAQKAFNVVYPETVIKVQIQKINEKNTNP